MKQQTRKLSTNGNIMKPLTSPFGVKFETGALYMDQAHLPILLNLFLYEYMDGVTHGRRVNTLNTLLEA